MAHPARRKNSRLVLLPQERVDFYARRRARAAAEPEAFQRRRRRRETHGGIRITTLHQRQCKRAVKNIACGKRIDRHNRERRRRAHLAVFAP